MALQPAGVPCTLLTFDVGDRDEARRQLSTFGEGGAPDVAIFNAGQLTTTCSRS